MGLDNLKKFYYEMLRIRLIEERIAALYSEQDMRCPVHLSVGQEVPAVGTAAAVTKNDYAVSSHRSHGHYIAKGGDILAMMAEIYGKSAGCSKGKGGSMHLIDLSVGFLGATPIVGSTIPIGVGAAFASKLSKNNLVTLIYFGEGSTEEGVFHESLNFALLKNLPAVFVCENNLYSVYSPLSVRQPDCRQVYDLAKGHGMESIQVDGSDVIEVYQATKAAVDKARTGKGPTFLEISTYRYREHCGPNYDNDIGYRTENEYQNFRRKDPLEETAKRLVTEKICQDSELKAMAQTISSEIEQAVAFAKAAEFPKKEELYKERYA